MAPDHINPLHWHQSIGLARQICARFFRDGGAPVDALTAFGIVLRDARGLDWSRAVDAIAAHLCARSDKKAA
jgi:hypothetical protein